MQKQLMGKGLIKSGYPSASVIGDTGDFNA
jgi:hypothetical protein